MASKCLSCLLVFDGRNITLKYMLVAPILVRQRFGVVISTNHLAHHHFCQSNAFFGKFVAGEDRVNDENVLFVLPLLRQSFV